MINEQYKNLIQPQNLIKHIDDFDAWLDLAECEKDLVCCLSVFAAEEMYEQCLIIKNKIDANKRKYNII